MNLEKLNYHPYIERLTKLYGKKNVFVYSLDELRKNQHKVVDKICNFVNVNVPKNYRRKPARVGYGLNALKLSLFLNRFFKTNVNPKGLIPWWGPVLPQNKRGS